MNHVIVRVNLRGVWKNEFCMPRDACAADVRHRCDAHYKVGYDMEVRLFDDGYEVDYTTPLAAKSTWSLTMNVSSIDDRNLIDYDCGGGVSNLAKDAEKEDEDEEEDDDAVNCEDNAK